MISALLATGRFAPNEYHLSVEDLACYHQLWTFASEHHTASGRAPTLELIRAKFPEFTFIPGIDIDWAADQLAEASFGRDVRRTVTSVLLDLSNNDYEAVRDQLSVIADKRRRNRSITGLDILDPIQVADDPTKLAIPVPWQTLADHTDGGIGFGELWNVGGRFESGKSMFAALCATVAAERGFNVKILSLEYPAKSYNRRIHRILARNDRATQLALRDRDPNIRREALERITPRITGSIETIDPSMYHLDISTVEDACRGAHLVVVDHVGLLTLPDGTPGIKDWRVAAQISNELRKINLRTGIAMLNVVQTNRESDTPGMRPPKVSQISQTDALGQDCDIAVMIKKPAETFQVHEIGKNRENSHALYYVKYDPEHGDFREISKQDALNMKLADEDRVASM